MRIFLEIQQ